MYVRIVVVFITKHFIQIKNLITHNQNALLKLVNIWLSYVSLLEMNVFTGYEQY